MLDTICSALPPYRRFLRRGVWTHYLLKTLDTQMDWWERGEPRSPTPSCIIVLAVEHW